MQEGGDDGRNGVPESERVMRHEAASGDRTTGLTPVSPHHQDDEWRRIGLGLRVLLAGAVADPLPAKMEHALQRLAEAEQEGREPRRTGG